MEVIDNIAGVIGYATVRADDGKIEEVKGSSANALSDLTAYFSSAGEAIRNNFGMGSLDYISLVYGNNRLIIVPYKDKYVGIETEREFDPQVIVKQLSGLVFIEKPAVEVPRALDSKMRQINLLIKEFGSTTDSDHWIELLNQSLGVLGRDIAPFMGVVEGSLVFKKAPPPENEDDFSHALRSVVDFLVKKAVEEMGSSQARAKVQTVIERMR
ncbi:MAG: roadblock/LC7 domain-containing protein [candidate division WOR-3 bacterium]|nr:MAG: roadblock/LC7 domain-containing protein [candidate division WOR-3 bacterium]